MIRLGSPPLSEQFPPLASPHPQPVFGGLPLTPPQHVARQAVALASHGTIYLVSFATSLPVVLKAFPHSPISLFVTALPRRFGSHAK